MVLGYIQSCNVYVVCAVRAADSLPKGDGRLQMVKLFILTRGGWARSTTS
jgi:hypothetical protein